MTEQEIMERINRRKADFFNEPAPIALDKWFCEKFESVYMAMSQILVPHRMYTVQSIIKKVDSGQPETITRHEAGFMAKVWLTMPPLNIEKNIDKFFIKRLFLEQISAKLDNDEAAKMVSIDREEHVLRSANRKGQLITV